MEFVPLKYDEVFKGVFSCEGVRKQFISDIAGISLESIREARLTSPFLERRYRRQKQGILDIAVVLQDGTKVDIEMQVAEQESWVKRKLFYLARMYGDSLRSGEHYERLRKCIVISVLDFSLREDKRYYTSYWLRDEEGKELTDLFELHIIELNKELTGTGAVEDWIRLFNAKSLEELNMIKTKNAGIREAIEEMKRMSLGKRLRWRYEEWLKAKRDRWAEDEFVRDQGRAEGETIGEVKGKAEDVLLILSAKGEVTEDLRNRILKETDTDVLNGWVLAAAMAKDVQEFREKIKQDL